MIGAVGMVKDEADILYYTVAHLLEQVDFVVIADNMSSDGTSDVIHELIKLGQGNVMAECDGNPAYYQAAKMTDLAHSAGRMGAEWVVPFDADEAWFFLSTLRALPADITKAYATQYVYVPTHADRLNIENPLRRIGHRTASPDPHHKVAFRYHPGVQLHQGSHDVYHPQGGETINTGVIRHYMYRSLEQVTRKVQNGVAAYNLTDLPAAFGSHWRDLACMTDIERRHWWDAYIRQPGLVYDPWPQ